MAFDTVLELNNTLWSDDYYLLGQMLMQDNDTRNFLKVVRTRFVFTVIFLQCRRLFCGRAAFHVRRATQESRENVRASLGARRRKPRN